MTARRLVLALILMFSLTAQAAAVPIIVQISNFTNINSV